MSAVAAPRRVRLFFDVVSPYSWFAFNTVVQYRALWERSGAVIELEPFFLGAVMAASRQFRHRRRIHSK
jgi:glutathione S-transferase kappa 1